MQAYLKFSRILTAVLLPLSHIDTAPVVEPYAPPTGDVNFGIIAAIVCIALFLMYVTLRGKQRK